MYFISYKCMVGEVGSYCQLAVLFFLVSPYQTRDNVVPRFIFDLPPPPFLEVWIRPWKNRLPISLCCMDSYDFLILPLLRTI